MYKAVDRGEVLQSSGCGKIPVEGEILAREVTCQGRGARAFQAWGSARVSAQRRQMEGLLCQSGTKSVSPVGRILAGE